MNQTFKPFDNLKIRQAVGYAINRQALVDAFFGETGVVLKNWAPPGTKFRNDLDHPELRPRQGQGPDRRERRDRPELRLLVPVRRSAGRTCRTRRASSRRSCATSRPSASSRTRRSRRLEPGLPGRRGDREVPGVPHRLELRLAGHRQLPVHGVLRLPRQPDGPEPRVRVQERRDERRPWSRPWRPPTRPPSRPSGTKAQDLILADLPSVPIVSGKTPAAGPTYVKGFVPSPTLLELLHRRLARQVVASLTGAPATVSTLAGPPAAPPPGDRASSESTRIEVAGWPSSSSAGSSGPSRSCSACRSSCSPSSTCCRATRPRRSSASTRRPSASRRCAHTWASTIRSGSSTCTT